jgi:hypothetical protein
LKDEDYARFDGIIDRFIQYDTGKLKGAAGRKALSDFNKLGPEAVFSLIDGFNRAAKMQDSCPCVIIGRKLAKIFNASQDVDLLEFARENLGAGGIAPRHTATVKDLRVGCMVRKSLVQRSQAAAALPGQKPLRSMSTADLAAAAGKEKGANLKKVLIELEKRSGPQVLDTLAIVAAGSDNDAQPLARTLLFRNLNRHSLANLKEKLIDERAAVRATAVAVITARKLPWGLELIDRLGDEDGQVSQGARRALVQLAAGTDHGPEPTASPTEREAATSRWREWWSQRPRR